MFIYQTGMQRRRQSLSNKKIDNEAIDAIAKGNPEIQNQWTKNNINTYQAKKKDLMENNRQLYQSTVIDVAKNNGMSETEANLIWNQIEIEYTSQMEFEKFSAQKEQMKQSQTRFNRGASQKTRSDGEKFADEFSLKTLKGLKIRKTEFGEKHT